MEDGRREIEALRLRLVSASRTLEASMSMKEQTERLLEIATQNEQNARIEVEASRQSLKDAQERLALSHGKDPDKSYELLETTRRTVAVVQQSFTIPAGVDIPLGPWSSFEAAEEEIKQYSMNPSLGGGRWKCARSGTKQPNSKRGRAKNIRCTRYAKPGSGGQGIRKRTSQGCECKWMIRLEDCVDGWSICNATLEHNHDLDDMNDVVMTTTSDSGDVVVS